MKSVRIFIIISISLILSTCRENETGPFPASIELSVVDVGATEAWLHVQADDNSPSEFIVLKRDGQPIAQNLSLPADTVILDDGLLPKHSYIYKAYRYTNTVLTDSSKALPVMLIDTTSNNFVWELDTLGDGNSSVLYDVALLNDTQAYTVGEIYLKDSTGQIDPILFNYGIWDGNNWSIKRVPYIYQGQSSLSPIRAVFGFSPSNIWFGIGNLIHWDGESYVAVIIPSNIWGPYRINKLWGIGSKLFIAGDGGSIALNDNGVWSKIETGTTQPITDIWGEQIEGTSSTIVYALASNIYQGGEIKILQIKNTTVTQIKSDGLPQALSGLWLRNNQLYVAGAGLYRRNLLSASTGWTRFDIGLSSFFSYAVRGDGIQVAIVGDFGEVITFNGATWKNHISQTSLQNGSYTDVAIKDNLLIAVGFLSNRACALIGRRQ